MRKFGKRDAERAARDSYYAANDVKILARYAEYIPKDANKIVKERLKLAGKLVESGTSDPTPREFGNAWPPIFREFADLLAQEEGTEKDREHNRIILQPTARQITQAEEALLWRDYVVEAQALAVLNIWLRCLAQRISWQKEIKRRGFAVATAKRRLERAFFLIAIGHAKDRRPLEEASR